MKILLETLKGIFFFLTIIVGLLFLRGKEILGTGSYDITRQIMIPGYLIFCGAMIGYIISRIWIGYEEEQKQEILDQIYTKSFLIGVVLGLILAIIYILI